MTRRPGPRSTPRSGRRRPARASRSAQPSSVTTQPDHVVLAAADRRQGGDRYHRRHLRAALDQTMAFARARARGERRESSHFSSTAFRTMDPARSPGHRRRCRRLHPRGRPHGQSAGLAGPGTHGRSRRPLRHAGHRHSTSTSFPARRRRAPSPSTRATIFGRAGMRARRAAKAAGRVADQLGLWRRRARDMEETASRRSTASAGERRPAGRPHPCQPAAPSLAARRSPPLEHDATPDPPASASCAPARARPAREARCGSSTGRSLRSATSSVRAAVRYFNAVGLTGFSDAQSMRGDRYFRALDDAALWVTSTCQQAAPARPGRPGPRTS